MDTQLIALATTTVLLLAACSPGSGAGEETGRPPSVATEARTTAPDPDAPGVADDVGAQETVEIVDFAFEPQALDVSVGTTVEWMQLDSSRHTVDFEDGERSGDLEEGDTYRRSFEEPGEHAYVCFFHPRMEATVTVTTTG